MSSKPSASGPGADILSFLASVEAWDARLTRSGNVDPFVTADWLDAWWHHFGAGRELSVFDAGGDGNFAVTHCGRERFSGVPLRVCRLLVNGHNLRASLGCDGPPDGLAGPWMDDLRGRSSQWDYARLEDIPVAGGLLDAMLAAASARGLRPRVERRWSHSMLAVESTWQDYLGGLKRETRKQLRRTGRRLEELGSPRWHRCSSPAETDSAFDAFLAMERSSWKAQSGEIIASRPEIEGFYRSVLQRFAARGQGAMDLYFLGDRLISGLFSVTHGRRLFVLKSSYDQEHALLSPSWHLFCHVLQYAFEHGIDCVDFCGRRPFTELWTDQGVAYCDVSLFSPSLLGQVAFVAKLARDRLRR